MMHPHQSMLRKLDGGDDPKAQADEVMGEALGELLKDVSLPEMTKRYIHASTARRISNMRLVLGSSRS